jgi:hypothetical protein
LLCVVLGDPERLEFLQKEQVAKSSREGGETVAVVCCGSLVATNLLNPVVGVVAAT